MEETFENQFDRLQQVVALLEDGHTPLEESLRLYEEGIRLIRACHEKLTGARRRIELITGLDSDGNPITQPLTEDERSLEEKSQTKGR